MATTAKSQKEKPRASRLTPRPTAASAARAARNALNRNLSAPAPGKGSLTGPASPAPATPEKRSYSPRARTRSLTSSASAKLHHPLQADISSKKLDQEKPIDSSYQQETIDDFLIGQVASSVMSYVVDEQPLEDGSSNHDSSAQDGIENETEDKLLSDDAAPRLHTPEIQGTGMVPVSSSEPETPIRTKKSRSRPQTPVHSSRLARSLPPSRPQTPCAPGSGAGGGGASAACSRVSSRASTPGHNRTAQPPAASPIASKQKIPSSAIPIPTGPRNGTQGPIDSVCPTVAEEDDMKSLFNAKRKQFQTLKKELDTKQQAILRTYDSLRNMTERLLKEGEQVKMEDLVVFNVADWPAEEVARLCRDATVTSHSQNAVQLLDNLSTIDENTIIELDGKVTNIPSKFADLCLQAFTARQEVIDWVKEVVETQCCEQGEGHNEHMEKIALYNSQGLELCEELRNVKAQSDSAVKDISQISKCTILERSVLISVGESLVKEIAQLRHDLDAQTTAIERIKTSTSVTNCDITLQDAQRQLSEERAIRNALKDKLATTESQLRQTRARVSKMDRQLREAEASIISLTGTVKSLEDQNRQREVHFEARARKLKENLKTGEVTNNHIAQQRDALQVEVQNLTEQLEATVSQNKTTIHDLQKEIKQLKTAFDEQVRATQMESDKNKDLEQRLTELRCAFDEYKANHPDIDKELPTEREIDLWAELQATKDTLRMTEDEVADVMLSCKREKVRFLETLTKISETEDKVGMQQKLAAELLNKEEIIGKMQIQIRELTKNIKLNEQKVAQYEQYVRDMQAHTRAAAKCQEAPNGISYQDLQQEIMTLRMKLLDTVHRKEELSEILTQKEQQLEQQDKTSRAQARIIKVREELINMLKNKETEQSKELATLQQDVENRMKIVEDVNKQIASKADEIQELFVTLENRQQQIHRLEKIVLALEEQQRRAQVQRTRYEEKIAALEHELSAGIHRERKFLFF